MPLALIPDRTEVLVDAEHDQDELGGDAREHDPGDHADQACDHQHEPGKRVQRHRRQPVRK